MELAVLISFAVAGILLILLGRRMDAKLRARDPGASLVAVGMFVLAVPLTGILYYAIRSV